MDEGFAEDLFDLEKVEPVGVRFAFAPARFALGRRHRACRHPLEERRIDASARKKLSLHDVLPADNDVFENFEDRDELRAALATLTDQERELVKYRFGGELSQMETAKRMGVSQMNVSRMERRVLQKLRESMKKSMVEG